jgi:hypothetical protein
VALSVARHPIASFGEGLYETATRAKFHRYSDSYNSA